MPDLSETGATRSSKFRVRSSENLELRTSNRRRSHPSRFSRKSRKNSADAHCTKCIGNRQSILFFRAKSRHGRQKRDPRFGVPGSKFRKPRTSNLELPLVSLARRLLGSDGGLNKLGPSSEVGRAPDLVGVVMVGAFNDIEGFRWFGCLEDLPTQLDRDNVVFVAVNDQLRQRELRKAIDQRDDRKPLESLDWKMCSLDRNILKLAY